MPKLFRHLPMFTEAAMLWPMRAPSVALFFALLTSSAFGQALSAQPAFEVASVRPSGHYVGPDYNNRITYLSTGFTARNATLKRLMAEAYHLQLNQIACPEWLDRNEYEIEAKSAAANNPRQTELMLRSLLAERFKLRLHGDTREMRVYQLAVDKSGLRIHPTNKGEEAPAGAGFHFHGSMRDFADLLALKLSIPPPVDPSVPVRASGPPVPVLDKTGLPEIFDFSIKIQPELGTDMFTLWQRALHEQLGLRLESRKERVQFLVVDYAAKIPTEN